MLNYAGAITCTNADPRDSDPGNGFDNAIELTTANATGYSITLINEATGTLTGVDFGIFAQTAGDDSPIHIDNAAQITAGGTAIRGGTSSSGTSLTIINSGELTAGQDGISARFASDTNITITNTGDISAGESGIFASTGLNSDNSVNIENHAAIEANFAGIYTFVAFDSTVVVNNTGEITAQDSGIHIYGFYYNTVQVTNTAQITSGLDASQDGDAIKVRLTAGDISITNTAALKAHGSGIYAYAKYGEIYINNTAGIEAGNDGIRARFNCDSERCSDEGGNITIVNQAQIAAGQTGIYANTPDGDVAIVNTATVNAPVHGIAAYAQGTGNSIAIVNFGSVAAGAYGIFATTTGPSSTNFIGNAGTVHGASAGIVSYSNTFTHIVNTGSISAGNLLAIHAKGTGDALVQNAGLITGYVIFDFNDVFHNQSGGTFEARRTSFFGQGFDQFINDGVVHTAANPNASETTRFVDLEQFQNRGLISMVDGKEGDQFQISQVVGAKSGLTFSGSGKSTLAVDAYLGPPGSKSDVFIIDGDVSGRTAITVNNTNPGPGSYNPTGIPVVYVNGKTNGNEFTLPGGPIDTGFFDYDLFFRPTGSGVFYLRNFINGTAHLLPQLVTGARDLFHATSETWLDRTADLRVLLNGGAPTHVPNLKDGGTTHVEEGGSFTPAVWVRGSGAWLSYDDKATTRVEGRTYEYNLDRDFDAGDLQTGIDFGARDFLTDGDIVVFGLLTGWVFADLDYDRLARQFDFSGIQAGGFVTYLNGGLFLDTLIKADFLDIEQRILGFPNSLDATNFGIRTDSGYRFGGFNGGFFFEPLATIEVIWSDIDSFAIGGNRVSFDDDPSVRGRLGLRVGTSYQAWEGTTLEPFIIGSVWGNLNGDNRATLVSNDTTFRLTDEVQDVWGVISGGLNIFNPGGNTSAFAKVDVTFGDDVDGLAARLGMRRTW